MQYRIIELVMNRSIAFSFLSCLVAIGIAATSFGAMVGASDTPIYSKAGELLFPSKYREWTYLTSGFDMSYSPQTASSDAPAHSTFDNVFVNPVAYRSFLDHGVWPDKTVLVLELRGAESKSSINKRGNYQGSTVTGVEVHIKDEARFPGKWAFFGFDNQVSGKLIPQSASCYSCHAEHGAVDTTFVQFYPTLLGVAEKKNTLSPAYLQELRTAASGSKN